MARSKNEARSPGRIRPGGSLRSQAEECLRRYVKPGPASKFDFFYLILN